MAGAAPRGPTEVARWRNAQATLVLTEGGRLLRRLNGLGGYSPLGGAGKTDLARATHLAEALEMERV